MSLKSSHFIELSEDELQLLRPKYENMICPKKAHVSDKRIWFVPKKSFGNFSLDYTCCAKCYYNNFNMSLSNGKYKWEDLIPILSREITMNCDESTDITSIGEKIDDDFYIGVYKNGENAEYKKLIKSGVNTFDIYFKDYTGELSIVLYKKIDNDDNNNSTLFAKVQIGENIGNHGNGLYSRVYPTNDEYCLTLYNLIYLKKNNSPEINYRPLRYNFYVAKKIELNVFYTQDESFNVLHNVKLNLIANNKLNGFDGICYYEEYNKDKLII